MYIYYSDIYVYLVYIILIYICIYIILIYTFMYIYIFFFLDVTIESRFRFSIFRGMPWPCLEGSVPILSSPEWGGKKRLWGCSLEPQLQESLLVALLSSVFAGIVAALP